MTTKSVISIDVDDEQFKSFLGLFNQFQDKLGTMPEDWKKVGDAGKESTEAFAAITGALVGSMAEAAGHAKSIGSYLKEASKAQKEFGSASGEGAKHLKSMAASAKALGSEIFGIGKFLFKLGAIGIGSFAGGLFGLDKLGNSAVSNQRNARTLGLTTGQFRAFDTDLGRYVDQNTLSAVANAQNDLVGRVWLARATGLSANAVQGTDAGTLSAQLALKAHDWWINNPNANDQQHFAATGFAQAGLDYESVRRQGNTPRSELERGLSQYQRDSQNLNYGSGTVNALYEFTNKLRLAGQALETKLSDKLSVLGPHLGDFITSLEKDAETLINGVLTPSNLKYLQDGLTTLANYLGSQDFKNDIKDLASGITGLAKGVRDALNFLHPSSPDANDPQAQANDLLDRKNIIQHPYNFVSTEGYAHPGPLAKMTYVSPYYENFNPSNPASAKTFATLAGYEKQYNLPKGFLTADIMAESSGNARAISKKGNIGAMQLGAAVIHDQGVKDPYDFFQNVQGGAKNFAMLFNRYKNQLPTEQLRLAIAASNWGPGNIDQVLNKYHGNWEQHIPVESEGLIRKLLAMMAKASGQKPAQIVITNKAGNNVAISTNAASR